jgi:predicted nucleotidyltransferase
LNSLDELLAVRERRVLFECTAGSRAYGTTVATSDEDVRGLFAVAAADYLDLVRPPDQLGDERGNVVYYSLRRTLELLSVANPNILELLYMPADCVRISSPEMNALVAERARFVSRQCADTHAGYAMSQIRKARGQNKWINNPKAEAAPRKEEFCHIVPWDPGGTRADAPVRPVPLNVIGWKLEEFHAARLEHARDTYRLYRYGEEARGVFRGDALVCESIPREDEAPRFAGLLLFNEQAWKQSLTDHQNYWAWRRERNPSRWEQQERGVLDFDAKNMMHTVRLLLSGRAILERGEPIVRFEGEPLQLLLDIRAGKQTFEEILALAEGLIADCERLRAVSDLPEICDTTAASRLLRSLTSAWERRVA